MKLLRICTVIICLAPLSLKAQQIINLYTDAIPNATPLAQKEPPVPVQPGMIRKSIVPTLEVYLPEKEKATGAAVIICPGGSYKVIVYDGEGVSTAKEFAKNGITAFVLKYRLPEDSFVVDKTIAPLQDAQQAFKVLRENASKWGINKDKIGIVGFSAGGHLASTVATHFQKALIENKNNTSLRPDFVVLVYPVISMQDSLTHADSRRNLLGQQPSKKLIDEYSNELQVNEQTPPTYLTHAGDDKLVDVDNSISFYEALRHHNVPAEMHIYPKGGHGFIFRKKDWMLPLIEWMKNSGWVNSGN
jgi:acetyl esterase/lipase